MAVTPKKILSVVAASYTMVAWMAYASTSATNYAPTLNLAPPDSSNTDSVAPPSGIAPPPPSLAGISVEESTTPPDSAEPVDLKYNFEDRGGDKFANPPSWSPLVPPDPSNVETKVEIDSGLGTYTIYEKVGDLDYRPVTTMTLQEAAEYHNKQNLRKQWKEAAKTPEEEERELEAPVFKLGPDKEPLVEIRPSGNVTLDFGGKWQRTDNPAIPVRQQRTGGFEFDQQISMNLLGTIGDRLKITANWDTKAQFDFDNNIKVAFQGKEHDMVRDVQAGNVSMPLNNSLIRGAQNLFGIKTQFQFGRLGVTALMSSQRGKSESLTIRGGAQSRQFEIQASEYDVYRHFFLSQYFKKKFDEAYTNNPANPNMGYKVSRVEVFITNTNTATQGLRNFVAFQDLGENGTQLDPRRNTTKIGENTYKIVPDNDGFLYNTNMISPGSTTLPDDDANNLMRLLEPDQGWRASDNTVPFLRTMGFEQGTDFERVNSARQLKEGKDFTFNPDLGFISLTSRLQDDEALAVSFEYTIDGQNYKVGEMTEDYTNIDGDSVIVLKLIKPQSIRPTLPMWDLMMKNVYSLNTSGVSREGFQFRVVYKDDLTGIDNPTLQDGNENIKDKAIIGLLQMDKLNMNGDFAPDGNFDFVDGALIETRRGRIILPMLEPFGEDLSNIFSIEDPVGANQLSNKYVFSTIYESTQNEARQNTAKNKFFLTGSFQSASSTDIMLPGINIAEGSVTITSGSQSLREGSDFTVDYSLGRVKILNTGVLASGKDITVRYEKADLFSFRTKSLLGTRLDYTISDDIGFGATLLHLNERPLLTRVSAGDEPIKNTQVGADFNYRSDSRLITKMVDFLPVIQTKDVSSIDAKFEAAALIPGSSRIFQDAGGASYLDDFEGAETPYDFTRNPNLWNIGSTPRQLGNQNGDYADFLADSTQYGFHRAKLSWFSADQTFFRTSLGVNGFELSLADQGDPNAGEAEDQIPNHYTRAVNVTESFPDRDLINNVGGQFEPMLDIAYYPAERGAFNYNVESSEVGPNGKFLDPKSNWASMTRAISFDNDFDNGNIEFIEFWMMDPFRIKHLDRALSGQGYDINEFSNLGGDMYFNLGDISEDVVRDGKMAFENGLPLDVDDTKWGKVTNQLFITNAFDNNQDRSLQDVGWEGLNNEGEQDFYAQTLAQALSFMDPNAYNSLAEDPSSDDFDYFINDIDEQDDPATSRPLLLRYKNFNGQENNSPINDGSTTFPQQNKSTPDNEDLNNDKNINDNDNYFQYHLEVSEETFSPDAVGRHPFIVGTNNTQGVDWYQVRIPIKSGYRKIGNIDGFQTIKFFRMYLTNFENPIVVRMHNLQLVSSQWRRFLGTLDDPDAGVGKEPDFSNFTIGTVNTQENRVGTVDQTSQYIAPLEPDQNQTSQIAAQLNEQSLKLCVDPLDDGDARAVFKNMAPPPLINYERMEMFVHAETIEESKEDGDLNVFIRLGTDQNDNYYEVEIPMKYSDLSIPPANQTIDDIWPVENRFDFALTELTQTKIARDESNTNPLTIYNREKDGYIYRIKGNPDRSAIKTVLIGARNPRDDGAPHSACFWVNELRITGFDKTAGYAAVGNVNIKLANLGNVSLSGQIQTAGYGDIETKVSERSQENRLQYGVATNLAMDKFLPKKAGVKLPLYVSYDKERIKPKYNPLNPDVLTTDSKTEHQQISTYDKTIKSINLTNVKKVKTKKDAKQHFFDVENINVSAGYSEETRTGLGGPSTGYGNSVESYVLQNYKGAAGYNYAFKNKPFEPFKKSKLLKSKYFKIIKDLSFNPVPSNIAINGNLNRRYLRVQMYNNDFNTLGVTPNYEKAFTFDRDYNLRWNLTKNLKLTYSAKANSIIDEPTGNKNGDGNIDRETYRDSVWTNIKALGRLKNYDQNINATYKIPIHLFPLTNFINSDLGYKAGYNWIAAPLGLKDTAQVALGSPIRNTQNITMNAKFNMIKLYNKSKFLKKINNPPRRKKSKKVSNPKNPDAKEGDKEEKKPAELKMLKHLVRAMMLVRNVNGRYTITNSTDIPGFMLTPAYFGLSETGANGPGLPFIMGSQNLNWIKQQGTNNDWFSTSESQNNPIKQSLKHNITAKATLEPFKNFRIQLDAKWGRGGTYNEIYRYNSFTDAFETLNPVVTGNLTMSYITLPTMFSKDSDIDNTNAAFSTFEDYRHHFKERLDDESEGGIGEFGLNSQDVLLPAFIAAYSGRDIKNPNDITANELRGAPRFPLPNWRLDYAGLARLPKLKKKFSSLNISHSYSSKVDISQYTSSLEYDASTIGNESSLGTFVQTLDTNGLGEYVPLFVANGITIREKFSPLIGINMRTKKKMTIRFDINKSRDLTLNFSNAQMTEVKSNDFVIGFGYTKKKLRFKWKGDKITLPNDITFKMDFTIRDTKTTQRELDGNHIVTAGNMNFQLKPNINYQYNKRLNIQTYFERTINTPKVSSSFRRASTGFGIRLRFSLA